MSHGAYHFAIPNISGGSTQASYFVAHGGGWTADGRTLPGVLDIEYNPWVHLLGLSRTRMVSWIRSFTTRYHRLTGRDAVIYTTLGWWRRCTGNSTAFYRTNPLWVATAVVGSARSRAAGRTRPSGSTPRPAAWTVTGSTATRQPDPAGPR